MLIIIIFLVFSSDFDLVLQRCSYVLCGVDLYVLLTIDSAKMVTCCAVCKKQFKKGDGRSFHKLPKDKSWRQMWCSILRQKNIRISINISVCSDHFIPSDFTIKPSGIKYLKKNALPSVESTSTSTTVDVRSIDRTHTNESEKENVIRVEKLTKPSISSAISENSKFVENEYNLSPQVEVIIKTESDEDDLITSECAEKWNLEVSDTNKTSPTAEIDINDERENGITLPPENPIEEIVLEVSDTNKISPTTGNYINGESEDEDNIPTDHLVEEMIQHLSDSSTLTALSEDPFATDHPSDAEGVASSTSIVSKTHLAFEKNLEDRRRIARYFGDCSADDLNNPSRAQRSWHIASRTISEQKAKIRRIQLQNRRLKSKIGNLNSLLTYLFHNYEFLKKS